MMFARLPTAVVENAGQKKARLLAGLSLLPGQGAYSAAPPSFQVTCR